MKNLVFSIENGILVYLVTLLFNRYFYFDLLYESIIKLSFFSINIALIISLLFQWVYIKYKKTKLIGIFKVSLVTGFIYIICSWLAMLLLNLGIITGEIRFLIEYSNPVLKSLLLGSYFVIIYTLLSNILNKSLKY